MVVGSSHIPLVHGTFVYICPAPKRYPPHALQVYCHLHGPIVLGEDGIRSFQDRLFQYAEVKRQIICWFIPAYSGKRRDATTGGFSRAESKFLTANNIAQSLQLPQNN